MILVCQNNNEEVVEFLLKHNANMIHKNADDETGFLIACRYNSKDAVQVLLDFNFE